VQGDAPTSTGPRSYVGNHLENSPLLPFSPAYFIWMPVEHRVFEEKFHLWRPEFVVATRPTTNALLAALNKDMVQEGVLMQVEGGLGYTGKRTAVVRR